MNSNDGVNLKNVVNSNNGLERRGAGTLFFFERKDSHPLFRLIVTWALIKESTLIMEST